MITFHHSEKDGDFKWKGAGTSVFGASPVKAASGSAGADDDDANPENDAPDVEFEPIVQLPEVTGKLIQLKISFCG